MLFEVDRRNTEAAAAKHQRNLIRDFIRLKRCPLNVVLIGTIARLTNSLTGGARHYFTFVLCAFSGAKIKLSVIFSVLSMLCIYLKTPCRKPILARV